MEVDVSLTATLSIVRGMRKLLRRGGPTRNRSPDGWRWVAVAHGPRRQHDTTEDLRQAPASHSAYHPKEPQQPRSIAVSWATRAGQPHSASPRSFSLSAVPAPSAVSGWPFVCPGCAPPGARPRRQLQGPPSLSRRDGRALANIRKFTRLPLGSLAELVERETVNQVVVGFLRHRCEPGCPWCSSDPRCRQDDVAVLQCRGLDPEPSRRRRAARASLPGGRRGVRDRYRHSQCFARCMCIS